MFTPKNKKKHITETINDIYFKSIEDAHKTKEYEKNKNQIEIIKKILIEKTDTPEALINLLIETVAENTALEYELANKEICDYLLKNLS